MAKASETEQYVLLPQRGLRATGRGINPDASAFLRSAEGS